MVIRSFVLLTVLLAMVVGVSPASAATVDECRAQLATLQDDTAAAAASFTNAKDVNGLAGKLEVAGAKLDAGKNADAIQKLVDFQSTLGGLAAAPKPKVDPAVAEVLVAEAQGVIDCVNALGAA
jgi:hypothetical protein